MLMGGETYFASELSIDETLTVHSAVVAASTGDTCRRRTGEVLDEGSKAMSVRYGVAEVSGIQPDCPVGTTADGGFDGNKSTAVLCESEPEDLNVGVDSKPDVDKIRNADKVSVRSISFPMTVVSRISACSLKQTRWMPAV
ncbi:hypothetical protein GN244_ATG17523 [Phytophthora infestans]|uniref:Uncharacterized protein n=1 Tax=Phytophthora infestans TaxID=4787 RepID=A0A833WEC8_PHYIN|nr:hypothetical protein GN244_ATG17523 [Phytophthora infestans]